MKGEKKEEKKDEEEDLLKEMKIVVNSKDISEDVQAEVADICLSVKNIKDPLEHGKLSKKIKERLDKKFDKGWNVIIGEKFTGSCSIAKKNFLEISISDVRILVFKSSALRK